MSAALDAPLARALGRGRHAAPARHRAPVLGDDFHRPLPRGRRSAERFEPMPLDVLERIVRTTVRAADRLAHDDARSTGLIAGMARAVATPTEPKPSWTVTPTWEQVITGPLDPEDNFAFWTPVPEREERTS